MRDALAPTVSVIVPAYNCGPYLGEALDSVLGQTLPPCEVIVVDDGSTDDTPGVCAAYGDRIRYVRQPNRGPSAARNAALALAKGDYLALLDADDVCVPDRFARQVAALRARPGAVGCLSGYWTFWEGGRVLNSCPADPADEARPPLDYLWYDLVSPITGLFDRRAAAGLTFPTDLRYGEDRVYLVRLRCRGGFVLLPDLLYGYRRREGQLIGQFSEIEGYRTRLAWVRAHAAEEWPDKTPREVEEGMWRSMARSAEVYYWTRRREQFLRTRDYLRSHWPGHLPPAPVLGWRWYPDWLWRAKDWLDRLRPSRTAAGPQPRQAGG